MRERLVELLMLALCRTGRPADALTAYEAARQRLAEALGGDPGPALRSLHACILLQDPDLLPSPPVPVARRPASAYCGSSTRPTAWAS